MAPSGTTAIALPGFGLAMREDARQPFSYVCDALLGVAPSEAPPSLSFAADGSLLVGSASGLRVVGADGCPRVDSGGELQKQPVARIAVHPGRANVVYAVTEGTLPRVWRSDDGGATWVQRASLTPVSPITALVLDPSEPDVVYVSQTTSSSGSTLHVSTDAGTSFSAVTQKAGLTLLDVEPALEDAGAARFWAAGRSATAMTNQGFSLFSGASPSGPWSAVADVRFFGGFARDPGGALWLGDEAGGVHRSIDGGGSFTNVSPTTAVSCLHFAQGALWGCTPGLAEQNTLVTWSDGRQAFDGVTALASVTRMVDCGPEVDVATRCAAAWVEWQRDILMVQQSPRDAGAPPSGTGGAPPSRPERDAGGPISKPGPDASTPVGEGSSAGCSSATRRSAPAGAKACPAPATGGFALGALWLVAARRIRRRDERAGSVKVG